MYSLKYLYIDKSIFFPFLIKKLNANMKQVNANVKQISTKKCQKLKPISEKMDKNRGHMYFFIAYFDVYLQKYIHITVCYVHNQ